MISAQAQRVLITGWPSFLHGEATAGDVLAMQAVAAQLDTAGVPHETAWSPVFRPGQLTLEAADPSRYSPPGLRVRPAERSRPHRGAARTVRWLPQGCHRRLGDRPGRSGRRRFPRDLGPGQPRRTAHGRPCGGSASAAEAGGRGHPGRRAARVPRLRATPGRFAEPGQLAAPGCGCALLPLPKPGSTSATGGFVRHACRTGVHYQCLARPCDHHADAWPGTGAENTACPRWPWTRSAGGAKVTAQSRALRWPAVLTPGRTGALDAAALDRWHGWCLSEAGRRAARRAAQPPPRSALDGLIPALGIGFSTRR